MKNKEYTVLRMEEEEMFVKMERDRICKIRGERGGESRGGEERGAVYQS